MRDEPGWEGGASERGREGERRERERKVGEGIHFFICQRFETVRKLTYMYQWKEVSEGEDGTGRSRREEKKGRSRQKGEGGMEGRGGRGGREGGKGRREGGREGGEEGKEGKEGRRSVRLWVVVHSGKAGRLASCATWLSVCCDNLPYPMRAS